MPMPRVKAAERVNDKNRKGRMKILNFSEGEKTELCIRNQDYQGPGQVSIV